MDGNYCITSRSQSSNVLVDKFLGSLKRVDQRHPPTPVGNDAKGQTNSSELYFSTETEASLP